MRKMRTSIPYIVYYVVYAFIYSGWLFHKSINPAIYNYSVGYASFLIVMGLFFFLPPIVAFCINKVGRKGFWFSLFPALAIVFVLYAVGMQYYYYTQKHLFDPFLQNPIRESGKKIAGKKEGVFRILCVGGSTTKNLGLPKRTRYPDVLAEILRKRYPSQRIEVINGGRTWYTTKHSLIGYITYYSDWNPDLVVEMHAINDICRSFSPPDFAIGEYNDLWTHFYGPAINGAKPPTFEKYLLSFFEVPLNAWYAGFRFNEFDYPPDRYVSLGAFEKNLEKMIRYVKNSKSEIMLVSQPSLYKDKMSNEESRHLYFGRTIANTKTGFMKEECPSPGSFRRAMDLFNKTARKIALKEGALFVDAAGSIEKTIENFRDDIHYTEKGARLLAESVARKIIGAKLMEKEI